MTLKEIADQYGFPFYFVASSLMGVYEAIAISKAEYGYVIPQILIERNDFMGYEIVNENTRPMFFQPLSDEYLFKEKFESMVNE